jgi:hypothetical protein
VAPYSRNLNVVCLSPAINCVQYESAKHECQESCDLLVSLQQMPLDQPRDGTLSITQFNPPNIDSPRPTTHLQSNRRFTCRPAWPSITDLPPLRTRITKGPLPIDTGNLSRFDRLSIVETVMTYCQATVDPLHDILGPLHLMSICVRGIC